MIHLHHHIAFVEFCADVFVFPFEAPNSSFFSTAVVFANPDMLVSFLMFFSETPTLDGYFNLLVFCYKHFWAGLPKIDQHNSVASLVLWWPRQALNVLTILPVTCQCGETT